MMSTFEEASSNIFESASNLEQKDTLFNLSSSEPPMNANNRADYTIALVASIPFSCLLIGFVIILCKRKVEDFYLKWCAIIIMMSMAVRVTICFIAGTLYMQNAKATTDKSENSQSLMMLKIQEFEFCMPLYFFVMVTVTIIFSALSFYVGLRDLLFPDLAAKDE